MKRSSILSSSSIYPDLKLKKVKIDNEEPPMMSGESEPESSQYEEEGRGFVDSLDENLLYEILKHVDARSLAMAGCVSKLWHRTAQDERLWELICTRHWANIGCSTLQLRSVVLALGGFRRLHSLYLWPLSKPTQPQQPRLTTPYSMMMPPSTSSSSAGPPAVKSSSSVRGSSSSSARLGKDEIQLSLSLFSIRYFEKMNFNGRGK